RPSPSFRTSVIPLKSSLSVIILRSCFEIGIFVLLQDCALQHRSKAESNDGRKCQHRIGSGIMAELSMCPWYRTRVGVSAGLRGWTGGRLGLREIMNRQH